MLRSFLEYSSSADLNTVSANHMLAVRMMRQLLGEELDTAWTVMDMASMLLLLDHSHSHLQGCASVLCSH